MKASWCTDIHLDHLVRDQVVDFCKRLNDAGDGPVFITGDISSGIELPVHLDLLGENVNRQVHFVLGNHDFYKSDVLSSRQIATNASTKHDVLNYLTTAELQSLTPSTAIIGHDGWYDAGYGDPTQSNFIMMDWLVIHDFVNAGATTQYSGMYAGNFRPNLGIIMSVARRLAADAAQYVYERCEQAAQNGFQEVIVLTHVPPFPETHMHQGVKGTPGAMPWYTSRIFGDVMLRVSKSYPDVNFLVLAGHTHGPADVRISHNLRCMVGGSEYGNPQICGSIVIR